VSRFAALVLGYFLLKSRPAFCQKVWTCRIEPVDAGRHGVYLSACCLCEMHPCILASCILASFLLETLVGSKEKEKFTLFSDGDGGLLRRQPGAACCKIARHLMIAAFDVLHFMRAAAASNKQHAMLGLCLRHKHIMNHSSHCAILSPWA